LVALSLLTFAMAAGPAATPAAAGVIDNGAIAKCRYAVTQRNEQNVWIEALLKRIAVEPPTVPKTAGTKSVGWRFIVERSLDRGDTPWVVTYRSPIQRAPSSAGFAPMRVGVKVPQGSETPAGQEHVWYHVTIKLFWFGSDGSVQSKATHLMNEYHRLVAGEELIDSQCAGLAQQFS
jgi:hypothetical protein